MTLRIEWGDDKIQKLKAMSFAGKSFRDIAAELGVSRSSIAGKVHRLNLSVPRPQTPWGSNEVSELRDRHGEGLSTTAIAKAMNRSRFSIKNKLAELKLKPNRVQVAYVRRARRTFADNLSELVACGQVERPVPIDDAAIPEAQRKTLMQLTNKCCHWPVGEVGEPGFFFCGGDAVAGLPYCHGHALRAYRPWEGRSTNGWRDLNW
jgi:GcrA cell cycle regulator